MIICSFLALENSNSASGFSVLLRVMYLSVFRVEKVIMIKEWILKEKVPQGCYEDLIKQKRMYQNFIQEWKEAGGWKI